MNLKNWVEGVEVEHSVFELLSPYFDLFTSLCVSVCVSKVAEFKEKETVTI